MHLIITEARIDVIRKKVALMCTNCAYPTAAGGYRPTEKTLEGGGVVTVAAPYKTGWVAAIVKK